MNESFINYLAEKFSEDSCRFCKDHNLVGSCPCNSLYKEGVEATKEQIEKGKKICYEHLKKIITEKLTK